MIIINMVMTPTEAMEIITVNVVSPLSPLFLLFDCIGSLMAVIFTAKQYAIYVHVSNTILIITLTEFM